MGQLLRFSGGRVALLGVAFALVLAASASAATTVTVGQTNPAAFECAAEGGGAWVVQEGSASDVVPAGEWVLTSWSTYASGEVGLMVFQPTGSGTTYAVVGESPVETIATTDTLSTFAVSIPVQPGDLIGIWLPEYPNLLQNCATTGAGSDIQLNITSTEPTVGSVVVSMADIARYRLDLSATLTPYPASQLCAATEAFVNSSPHSSIWARLAAVQACGALYGRFIKAYESDVTRLYDNGWLTATQEANLEAAASYL